MITDNIYAKHGFADRNAYLEDLADSHGVDPSTVRLMADILGPNEDFDGLVTSLEDGEGVWIDG